MSNVQLPPAVTESAKLRRIVERLTPRARERFDAEEKQHLMNSAASAVRHEQASRMLETINDKKIDLAQVETAITKGAPDSTPVEEYDEKTGATVITQKPRGLAESLRGDIAELEAKRRTLLDIPSPPNSFQAIRDQLTALPQDFVFEDDELADAPMKKGETPKTCHRRYHAAFQDAMKALFELQTRATRPTADTLKRIEAYIDAKATPPGILGFQSHSVEAPAFDWQNLPSFGLGTEPIPDVENVLCFLFRDQLKARFAEYLSTVENTFDEIPDDDFPAALASAQERVRVAAKECEAAYRRAIDDGADVFRHSRIPVSVILGLRSVGHEPDRR